MPSYSKPGVNPTEKKEKSSTSHTEPEGKKAESKETKQRETVWYSRTFVHFASQLQRHTLDTTFSPTSNWPSFSASSDSSHLRFFISRPGAKRDLNALRTQVDEWVGMPPATDKPYDSLIMFKLKFLFCVILARTNTYDVSKRKPPAVTYQPVFGTKAEDKDVFVYIGVQELKPEFGTMSRVCELDDELEDDMILFLHRNSLLSAKFDTLKLKTFKFNTLEFNTLSKIQCFQLKIHLSQTRSINYSSDHVAPRKSSAVAENSDLEERAGHDDLQFLQLSQPATAHSVPKRCGAFFGGTG